MVYSFYILLIGNTKNTFFTGIYSFKHDQNVSWESASVHMGFMGVHGSRSYRANGMNVSFFRWKSANIRLNRIRQAQNGKCSTMYCRSVAQLISFQSVSRLCEIVASIAPIFLRPMTDHDPSIMTSQWAASPNTLAQIPKSRPTPTSCVLNNNYVI